MKYLPVFVFCLVSAAACSQSINTINADLKVKRLQTSGRRTTNFQTDYGSFDKDKTQSISLEVSVRNMSADQQKFTAVVAVLARDLQDRNDTKNYVMYDAADFAFELKPLEGSAQVFDSDSMESNRSNYVALGAKSSTGYGMVGWVVWLMCGDKMVKVIGSTKPIEALAQQQGLTAFRLLSDVPQ